MDQRESRAKESVGTEQWFYEQNGESVGPFSGTTARQWVEEGSLQPTHRVRREGEGAWRLVSDCPQLLSGNGLPSAGLISQQSAAQWHAQANDATTLAVEEIGLAPILLAYASSGPKWGDSPDHILNLCIIKQEIPYFPWISDHRHRWLDLSRGRHRE